MYDNVEVFNENNKTVIGSAFKRVEEKSRSDARKTWGDRVSGFLQAFFTSGGRNGVGLQAGFRISIGKAGTEKTSLNNTPTLPKTQIKLNSMR